MSGSPDDVVIVEAVRSPLGKRNGSLSAVHPADLLGTVLKATVERSGIDPADVGQIIGGCVEQVGEQAANVTRSAWLDAGLPESVAAVSLDSACGSAQQAVSLAAALVGSGTVESAIGSGLSSMSRLPIAASFDVGFEAPPTRRYGPSALMDAFAKQIEEYGFGQFGCAERVAEIHGVTRADADAFGLRSQQLAAVAWAEGRFDREIVPVRSPVLDCDGFVKVSRDECLRDTTAEGLAALKPIARDDGVHTPGTSSQISDGAAAVLVMTARRARVLGLKARARIVDHCHVGVDPLLMLSGPLDATELLLKRTGMTIDQFDLVEINEAFAAVPLIWLKHFNADLERLNPNGGGIALGHPVGATGARLITTALHELERSDGTFALISMCAGGGLGTGTIIERI